MKITGFNTLIATKDAEKAVALFEALGFEKRHKKEGIGEQDITTIRMKDANGFHVDVAAADYPQDVTIIRINVDNFNEAYEIFTRHGFKRADGFSDDVDTGSSKFAILISPTGFVIDVAQHIKK